MLVHRRYFGLYGVLSAVCGFLIMLSLRGGGPSHVGTELFSALAANIAYLILTCAFYGLAARCLGRQSELHEATSSLDPRTGLGNTRLFESRFVAEASLAVRHKSSLAVLVIDVDDLKTLNDKEGHRAGDRALLLVANALKSVARAEDVVARWGGDEFAILAPRTGRVDAFALANRVQRAVSSLSNSRITVSIGVAATESAGWIPPSSLFDAADTALYQAKREGRNRAVLSEQRTFPAAAGSLRSVAAVGADRNGTFSTQPEQSVSERFRAIRFPLQEPRARLLRGRTP